MICYNCGTDLDASDVCPGCGMEVGIWKKICAISNRLYNEGLEKAQVRDLSGAIASLRLSLRYNKKNIPARNLLGLVYYEMGDSVQALSEWVISKSEESSGNPAAYFISTVQKNAGQLSVVNQSLRKFNQSLVYCRDGNYDLALIQLKKVCTTNPKLVKAHQLLALLYMQMERHDLAMRQLKYAARVDANNTMTLRYMKECREYLKANGKLKPKKEDDVVTYQSENDIIIRPTKLTDNTAVRTVVNLFMGVAIGVAFICFLVVPQLRQRANTDASDQIVAVNQSLAASNRTISDLNDQIDALGQQMEDATNATESASEVTVAYQLLLRAWSYYENGDYDTALATLENVDRSQLETNDREIYDSMNELLKADMLSSAYDEAMALYSTRKYGEAAEKLLEIVENDPSYDGGGAAYYLGFSYNYTGDYNNAVKWLTVAVENMEDATMKTTAQKLLDSLNAEGYTVAEDELVDESEETTLADEEASEEADASPDETDESATDAGETGESVTEAGETGDSADEAATDDAGETD